MVKAAGLTALAKNGSQTHAAACHTPGQAQAWPLLPCTIDCNRQNASYVGMAWGLMVGNEIHAFFVVQHSREDHAICCTPPTIM